MEPERKTRRWIRSVYFVVAIFLVSCASSSVSHATVIPSLSSSPNPVSLELNSVSGDLQTQLSFLEENMPLANSEGYRIPSIQAQKDFTSLLSALEKGHLSRARALASENGYELVYYGDRPDDNALSYLLRETTPIQKGWGLYALRVNPAKDIILEAPHPYFDERTSVVALDVYRALDARALLVAGAHRDANQDGMADVAHVPESVFQSVHKALVVAGSADTVVLQIHGFSSSKHRHYPQVVIGSGSSMQGADLGLAQKLSDALSSRHWTVGLCIKDAWSDLCGTKNVQASAMDAGVFLHIELNEEIRKDDGALVSALVDVFEK